MMKDNPLLKLRTFGQSIWMDYISRHMITSGELLRLVEEDGISGVTSNPAIFEQAIARSHDYDDAIRSMAIAGKTPEEIYEALTIEDVQTAADVLRPTFEKLAGQDGFVSLEVNPHLAHNTEGAITEARGLWAALHRPNVFIKVPATVEGLPAIRQLISDGIHVNVTLLFGLPRYEEVADSYISGLEERAATGKPINKVTSVASFFLSRIDVLVDALLEKIVAAGGREAGIAAGLRGQVAIASAKVAYSMYGKIFAGERFQRLAAKGAAPQRVLWASTSTKNPDYSDLKYIEPLIGPATINTMPVETINAYRDHGDPASRLEEGVKEAVEVLAHLADLHIDIDEVTQQLEDEGVEKFNKPFDNLMSALEAKRRSATS